MVGTNVLMTHVVVLNTGVTIKIWEMWPWERKVVVRTGREARMETKVKKVKEKRVVMTQVRRKRTMEFDKDMISSCVVLAGKPFYLSFLFCKFALKVHTTVWVLISP